jgi:hypothetical protein
MTIVSTELRSFVLVLYNKHESKGISLENTWKCELPNFPAEITSKSSHYKSLVCVCLSVCLSLFGTEKLHLQLQSRYTVANKLYQQLQSRYSVANKLHL